MVGFEKMVANNDKQGLSVVKNLDVKGDDDHNELAPFL